MGRTGESNVERGSLGKSPRPSRRRKLSLPWKELQGGWEILPLLLVLAAFFLDPYKLGFLMETPSPNCHTGLPTNIATVKGQFGKKLSSDFSQCVDREQGSGEKNYLSFFIIRGITHSLQRTRSRQLWGCKSSGPKPAGTLEGVFSCLASGKPAG